MWVKCESYFHCRPKAALTALDHAWSALAPLGYPLAVTGGISLAAWNYVRAKRDVDLLIAMDRSQVDPILKALAVCGCRPKQLPAVTVVGEHCFVQLLFTPPGESYDVQLDLSWIACLDLTTDLVEIWHEAFPGEEVPQAHPPAGC
jgi:hypothetical protein